MAEEIKKEINTAAEPQQSVADAQQALEAAKKALAEAAANLVQAQAAEKSVEERIEEVLEAVIRPAVGEHGGDAELNYVEDGVAYINLSGACAGCPSADTETRAFIEQELSAVVPEIKRVEIDNTIPTDIFDEMRAMFSKSYGKEK